LLGIKWKERETDNLPAYSDRVKIEMVSFPPYAFVVGSGKIRLYFHQTMLLYLLCDVYNLTKTHTHTHKHTHAHRQTRNSHKTITRVTSALRMLRT
jgi:hypothetical protein